MFRVPAVFSVALTMTASVALAQSGKIFDKSYPVNGRPDLQVAVDNSSVHAQSCGSCREVHVHVDTRDRNLSDFRLEESQSGNTVRFSLKQPPMHSLHFGDSGKQPVITISLPADANVKLEADNGEMSLAGVNGSIEMHSDNGVLTLQDSRGSMHLNTDNGRIAVERVEGTMNAQSENGAIEADGRFSQIDAKTGNGPVRLRAEQGSTLSNGVHISTGNGTVDLHLPRTSRAEMDLHTDRGAIHCNLPLQASQSGGDEGHHVHGALNGGGSIVRIGTGNGSIHVDGI